MTYVQLYTHGRTRSYPSIFICPITNNQNANKRAVGQDSETTRVLNTALNTKLCSLSYVMLGIVFNNFHSPILSDQSVAFLLSSNIAKSSKVPSR